jgi:hypothetical protein
MIMNLMPYPFSGRVTGCLILVLLGLLLPACQGSATPDQVATEVAVQKAAIATLTAEAPASAATATPTLPTDPDTPSGVTATLTTLPPTTPPASPTPAAVTPEARCRVITSGLNLRPGPGTVFEPPLEALANGAELIPLAFSPTGFPGGQWLEVQTPSGQVGWISADPQLINCNIPFTTLPAGVIPPTPTPPSTPTSPPAPTPTPLIFAVVPVDGTDDNDFLQGRRVILPGFSPQQVTIPPVFRDQVAFAIEAYDIRFGTHDGAGIEQVEITITYDSDDGDSVEVHRRVEQQAGFCAFGGGEPACTVWVFAEHDNRWPSGQPIFNGSYSVDFDITPQEGEITQWRWSFEIDGLDTGTPPDNGDVVAEIVQTGLGTDSNFVTTDLVFQVRAFHTGYGNDDGDGIDRVELRILNDQNQVVYQKTENTAAYCAFGGGEPDCATLPLQQIDNGFYTLQATAYAEDGQTASVSTEIEVQGQY